MTKQGTGRKGSATEWKNCTAMIRGTGLPLIQKEE